MITRNPVEASGKRYDIAIVGGGIHGISLALESSRRGLSTLLLERSDFAGETSWNSMRILHGGLRYLQSFDLGRFYRSVEERGWFLRTFPVHTKPIACMMPLYNSGLHRKSALRLALTANNVLSFKPGAKPGESGKLPKGRIISVGETCQRFPDVEKKRLKGSALWFDGLLLRPQRVAMEMLHWAANHDAYTLNYMTACGVIKRGDQVVGVRATDRASGADFEFQTRSVINCAGPWSREVSATMDRDVEDLFYHSMAVNILIDRAAPKDLAVAVSSSSRKGKILFLCPWNGKILAGTAHLAWPQGLQQPTIEESTIKELIDELNSAIPWPPLRRQEVLRALYGLLPATGHGQSTTASQDRILHHESIGGPRGLFSVTGVKYTTARFVAEKTLKSVARYLDTRLMPYQDGRPPSTPIPPDPSEMEALLDENEPQAERVVRRLIETESVVIMDDLLKRRTDWGTNPRQEERLRSRIRKLSSLVEPRLASA